MKKNLVFVLELIIIISAIIWACVSLKTVFLGEALTSRFATVYALTYHKTWYINRPPELSPNPFENQTVDKVQGKHGIISSKPPILSLFMTIEYQIIRTFGFSLNNKEHYKPIARIMIILNVLIPYFTAILLIWKFLYEIKVTTPTRIVLLTSLLFGTQWSALAPHFTNHVPATSFLIIGLYYVWKVYSATGSIPSIYLFLIGLCASLVYTIDLPLTIFIACAILFLLAKKKLQILPGIIIGALPILFVHFSIMYHITGNILPVQISKEPFLFESSYWRHPLGPDALHHSKLLYTFNILIGTKGLFILYPVLVFGILIYFPSIWKTLDKDIKFAVLIFLFSFILFNLYYILSTNNYGGVSYGFRWHTGGMPLLLFSGMPYIENKNKKIHFWFIWLIFIFISLYSTYECRTYPWSVDKEWTTRLLFRPLL